MEFFNHIIADFVHPTFGLFVLLARFLQNGYLITKLAVKRFYLVSLFLSTELFTSNILVIDCNKQQQSNSDSESCIIVVIGRLFFVYRNINERITLLTGDTELQRKYLFKIIEHHN